jgi:hypothetical protein
MPDSLFSDDGFHRLHFQSHPSTHCTPRSRVTGFCGPVIREASIAWIGLRKINEPALAEEY